MTSKRSNCGGVEEWGTRRLERFALDHEVLTD
jgi:hypothetical protein